MEKNWTAAFRTRIASLFIVLLASACSVQPYNEPATEDRAHLRLAVQNTSSDLVEAVVVPNGTCLNPHVSKYQSIAILGGPHPRQGKQGVRVGMPDGDAYADRQLAEIYIPSGQKISLDFIANGGNWHCHTPFSFIPEGANDYEAIFTLQARQCRVRLSRITRIAASSYGWEPVHAQQLHICQ
ncbi:hypothetical protein [Paraburkholderia domus]|uniref:Lipoprotein n=1 Tax=Paraburkholderia domus TaxID=2793075 RepID=A0A9N8R2C2_9BURK|nr:hypothetical protein [Paraburkholderia domus]MBK5169369.1 hypothetical protein [Burkholderia sp. R-70211]CAE6935037.1 hypothetical protein R70211_05339 [Paraburkholderia domus]